MNLYHCFIDLKDDAKALSFALALDNWMGHLKAQGTILSWRLLRRKLNLAADGCRDFLLEIEVEDLSQLDRAYRLAASQSDDVARLYGQVNQMISRAEFGLYRPFPDPERAERVALL
ncbi:DUF6614 family protein [Oceanicella sp. SM1341]|uniref:DUF6614 family protein n=1 Tax=Oceanicella sp. SM1341 TaxID=1548889 RepID=UPI000E532A3C|nr:DUF6614 family protein [Oceanicella sp. SM1341]